MIHFLCMTALCILMISCVGAGRLDAIPKQVTVDKVVDVLTPVRLDQIRIDGLLGERMRVNLEKRLLQVDEEAILAGFEKRPGSHPWIGEHAGKFLHAAANAWAYSGNEQLKLKMDRVASRLIRAQMEDGYLGTYAAPQRWTGWDVWVHKYDLIGLLEYFKVSGDSASLDACRRIGDLLCATFGDGPGQRDIIKSGEHMGMAATSVLEPMCVLYRYTGDRKYLDFCHYIVRSYDHAGGPGIVSNIARTGRVYGTANNKAYEMLSNLVGLLELYRCTGEKTFFDVPQRAWQDIAAHRLYITGTTSSHEFFTDDGVLPAGADADVGEGCVTVTWLQLNWHLLRLTGEARYADQIERTIYNQLLGAQNFRNGDISYFTPLDGRRKAVHQINCCLSSEPRGIAMIPLMACGTRADGSIQVNLYAPFTARMGDCSVRVMSDFPRDGAVSVTVSTDAPRRADVLLRAPAWSRPFEARFGKEFLGAPTSGYLRVGRVWNDQPLEIKLDISAREVSAGPNDPSRAVERGPQVLAEPVDPPAAEDSTPVYHFFGHTLIPFADAQDCRVWLKRS
jgi:DUF1680 family protein